MAGVPIDEVTHTPEDDETIILGKLPLLTAPEVRASPHYAMKSAVTATVLRLLLVAILEQKFPV
jgi:hypothetical protein